MNEEELAILNSNDWYNGFKIIMNHWNTDYGTIAINQNVDNFILELTTGGWSENEEIIDQLCNTFFWFLWWQESHRGGYYKFIYKGGIVNG